MKRTAVPPRRQFVSVATGWLLLAFVAFLPTPGLGARLFFGAFALLLVALTANVLVARASVDGEALRLRAVLPGRRLRASLESVVSYRQDKGGRWWVEAADRRVPVPVAEPWELHAGIAALAPRALNAKRIRPKTLPPAEDFRGLWVYDVERLLSETVGRAMAMVALVALTHRVGGAYGILLGPLFFGLFDLGARLDVTREGIVRRGPFHRRAIPWSEAVAIFCERSALRRSFVVTSRKTAVEIPEHLAKDLDLMRKVLLSLPEGTLCVNFDETTFRGYRRRKTAKEPAALQEDLMPALTA